VTPAWLLDVFAALMLGVAAVSAARLAAAWPWRHGSAVIDTDVAHLLMAIAMAGMLTPSLATLPDTAWEVICGLLGAWFAVRVALDARAAGARALAGGHCAPHLVHSVSMLYMFLALSSAAVAAGMNGMSGGPGAMAALRYPTLAYIFALVLAGYAVWDLDQLSGRRPGLAAAAGVSLAGAGAARVPARNVAGSAPGSGPAARPAAAAPEGDGRTAVAVSQHARRDAAPRNTGAAGSAAGGIGGLLLSPAVTVGCRIAMGVVMAFMLVVAA
jgi:hypothetical protein